MPTLIEIAGDALALQQLIEEADSEITPEIGEALDRWFAEVDAGSRGKVDNYLALIEDLELRAASAKAARDRLARRAQADENAAKRLKRRLQDFFEMSGVRRMTTARYNVSVCNNGGAQPIDVQIPAEELPPEFQRVRVEPNMEAIRDALAIGTQIGGVVVLPRGSHLRVT